MVWAGLSIALISALVKSCAELEFIKGDRILSVTFLKRNKFTLAVAGLAILGFMVAALAVLDDREISRQGRSALRQENDRLIALSLDGKDVSPTITITLWVDNSESLYDDKELEKWLATDQSERLPKPIGFVSTKLRQALFPDAHSDKLTGRIGVIEIRDAIGQLLIGLSVRQDGSIISTGAMKTSSLRVSEYSNDVHAIKIEIDVEENVDSLMLYTNLVNAYERDTSPLGVVTYTHGVRSNQPRTSNCKGFNLARISFSLNETKQILAGALLKKGDVKTEGGAISCLWNFSEAPVISTPVYAGHL